MCDSLARARILTQISLFFNIRGRPQAIMADGLPRYFSVNSRLFDKLHRLAVDISDILVFGAFSPAMSGDEEVGATEALTTSVRAIDDDTHATH